MNWLNLFRSQPQPTTFDEGIATVPVWTEADIVAWLNRQDPAHQRLCWDAIKRAKDNGDDPLPMMCELRRRVEARGEDADSMAMGNLIDQLFALRVGWWFGGILSGKNKLG